MTQSMHERVVAGLQATKGRWPMVARETGISRRTIEKIARREISDPSASKVELLHQFLRDKGIV